MRSTGSSNESRNAYEHNRECFDVYPSWSSGARAERKRAHFEALWANADEGVEVYSFPDAARRKLLRVCGEREGRRQDSRHQHQSRRWRHQDEAVSTFVASERGVLNMATGTGKTRTALKIIHNLYTAGQIDTVIVCADGNDLLGQWYGEILRARRDVRPRVPIFRHYAEFRQIQEFTIDPRPAILVASRERVHLALEHISVAQGARTILVHDEVHRLGSPGNRAHLAGMSNDIRFRLGLSATPERPYDEDGNAFLEAHVGPVLVTFGLQEAIERGILAPFTYHPLPYPVSDDDRAQVAAIYRRQKARQAAGEPTSEAELWIEIARVHKTSLAKLPVFQGYISRRPDLLRRCIVFSETMGVRPISLGTCTHAPCGFSYVFFRRRPVYASALRSR